MKKYLSIILVIAMLFSLALPAAAAFTDTAEHWAAEEIDRWTGTGILNGYPDGSFKPNGEITRGEFFKIISSLCAFTKEAENSFSDLPDNAWYAEYVLQLVEAGIVEGYEGKIRGGDPITRQEAFAIIARLFGVEENAEYLSNFSDGDKVSEWAKGLVGGLAAAGYIHGSDGKINAAGNIKRSEAVKVIDNIASAENYKKLIVAAAEDAGIPDAAEFAAAGNTVCLPDQEIIEWQQYENPIFGQVGKDALIDETKYPYTDWDLGHPAIESEYGNAEATGLFAMIEILKGLAPEDYDIEKDEELANILAFAELYAPAAAAGTAVDSKTVYVADTSEANVLAQEDDPDGDFESSQPYRVYTKVIEVGAGPMEALRVLDCIPASSPFSLGPATYESFNALVYEVGINNEGIVVSYDRVPTDSVASYSAVSDGAMRIGYYASEVFDIAKDAKLYMLSTETVGSGWGASTVVTGVEEGDFSKLEDDWNDSIRVVLNEDMEIVEAYIMAKEGAGEAPANIEDIQKFEFVYGVEPDDPEFGYNGSENPYAVDYALYNPISDEDNTTAKDTEAKYPLFVFFHGIGGGSNKNGLPTNDAGVGLRYIQPDYQAQFETSTEGVHGAFVMLPRANETSSHDLSTQGWLHGYRAETNPLYAAGDENYKGEPTQTAAVIANIKQLIAENPNIDPDRIYITGFSAGGYMTWHTLIDGGNLFAAAAPGGAAFFPEGSQLSTDYSEFELGFAEKLLNVKDVPIWMYHARNDDTCAWDICAGDTVKDSANFINGFDTLPEMVRSLSDGVSEIQGSPLTRVTIHNYLHTGTGEQAGQHSPMLVYWNNIYEDITVEGSELSYFDMAYGEKPADYDEANPSDGHKDSLYAYGINTEYSTAESWGDSFISWLNACGAAKAAG